MKVEEDQEKLELNGTNDLLFYADDVKLLDKNIKTIYKSIEALSEASKGVGQAVNREN
jgi:hypothetical protein